jgi:MoaA/NifB/PqqE/SkfB family radical SAM enzyme
MKPFDQLFAYKSPRILELEITTKCTLFCHSCARTLDPNEEHSEWKFGQLSLESIDRATSSPGLQTVFLSGAFGDAIYHTELLEVIKLIKSKNLFFRMDTNGSYRSKEWWEEIGKVLTKSDRVVFSIDGLPGKDLYRVNSDWPSIETGIKTLASTSKVDIHWKWIVFRYNQDDVLEGYRLSKELGFSTFQVVHSGRQHNSPEFKPTKDYDEIIAELTAYKEAHQ